MHGYVGAARRTLLRLALVLWAGTAGAASPERPDVEPATRAGVNAEVTLALVGALADDASLKAVLTELLGRRELRARFVTEPRFRAERLLSGATEDPGTWVFIDLVAPDRVRLYFRDPEAKRFLLRDLNLAGGLDELGRELVGQVVESSVVALQSAAPGMSRDEAEALLERDRARQERAAPPESTRDYTPTRTPSYSDPGQPLMAWVALRYGGTVAGSELALGHGPGAEVGLTFPTGTLEPRLRAVVEERFAQTISSHWMDTELHTRALRLSGDLGFRVRKSERLSISLGAGADRLHLASGQARDPAVVPTPASTHYVAVLRSEVRYEFAAGIWRMGAVLSVDTTLARSHYDVELGTRRERAATPWVVRPGLALVLGLSPSLGTRGGRGRR